MLAKSVPAVLVFSVFLISACVSQPAQVQDNQTQGGQGLSGATAPSLKAFKIVVGHTFYSPNIFEVSRGDRVRFMATSAKGTGLQSGFSHNHGVTVDEYGVDQAVTTEDEANPVIIEFVASEAGEFRIYCKTCLDGPFGQSHPAIQAKLVVR